MLIAVAAFALQMLAQAPRAPDPAPVPSGARSVSAVVAARPPVIDGRDDDPVWRTAVPITAFREWQPTENADPKLATEARIAYDAANLYVFMRAYDPHPDSIIRGLARRDTWTPSDHMGVIIDSYHDRRNGYEFFVNPSGVKVDQAMYDDGNEDNAWDAVWDVAVRIDSLGWTAEFRIPLSQLRFGRGRDHTFGIVAMRDIYRYNERLSWPLLRQSQAGAVSQFGDLTGLADLDAPRRFEAAPYLVTKNATAATSFARTSTATVGADVKYRVASNLTFDGTVNPDFGEVEEDPSVFNLTTVESYFSERRPFFVAGAGLFQFNLDCTAVNCGSGEGLFYSRRIGHTPQLADTYDASVSGPVNIIGAGKLTGRLANGLTIGAVDAVTARSSAGDTTLEPTTNYSALRVRQDLRNGETSIGAMVTTVNRSSDGFTSPYLTDAAYAGALDFRHRLPGKTYEFSGSLAMSRIEGSPAAITAVEEDPVHYYQRPDGALRLDTTATALTGTSAEARFAKVSGRHLMFETDYQSRSGGFEVNDLGYLQRADQQVWATWAGYFDRARRRYYQRFQWNWNWWQLWTAAGLPQERAFNTNTHITLLNNWTLNAGGTIGQLGTTYDDRAARGGPALRQVPYYAPWAGIQGDDRHRIVPYLWFNYTSGHEGGLRDISWSPEVDFRLGTPFTSAISLGWDHNRNDAQWYGNYTDSASVTHYTFAHLDQHTLSLTARLNYALTPNVSFQLYAQPFITKGSFSGIRELSATPRADAYADRFAAYGDTSVTNNPGGFNYRALNSNVVFRWEYRPGSVLFLVWSQGRVNTPDYTGSTTWHQDLTDLFGVHARNTFLVKLSYWLNR